MEGFIKVPGTNPGQLIQVKFKTSADDASQLIVNGNTIIDDWNSKHAVEDRFGSIYLLVGQVYPITCWFAEFQGGAVLALYWSVPDGPGNGTTYELLDPMYVATRLEYWTFDDTLVWRVRVQVNGINFLHMREVQVFDMNGVNRALNKPANQSSTYTLHDWGSDPASKAVNGNLTDFSCTNFDEGTYHEVTNSDLFFYSTTSVKPSDPLS
jgi:hypothetical protein